MIPLLVGSAFVGVVTLPDKTVWAGPHLAAARVSYVEKARQLLDREIKAKRLESDEETTIRKNLVLLRRRAAQGWTSEEELAALGTVSIFMASAGANALGDSILELFGNK